MNRSGQIGRRVRLQNDISSSCGRAWDAPPDADYGSLLWWHPLHVLSSGGMSENARGGWCRRGGAEDLAKTGSNTAPFLQYVNQL